MLIEHLVDGDVVFAVLAQLDLVESVADFAYVVYAFVLVHFNDSLLFDQLLLHTVCLYDERLHVADGLLVVVEHVLLLPLHVLQTNFAIVDELYQVLSLLVELLYRFFLVCETSI